MSETIATSAERGREARFALTTEEGRALALFFVVPGSVAGLALWLVQEFLTIEGGWAAFLAPAVLFGTGAWTLITAPSDRTRALFFAVNLGVALGALGWSATRQVGDDGYFYAGVALPALGWVALSFYRAGPRDYAGLFASSWNLPLVLAIAVAFAGAAYGVLWLLAAMFRLIGLTILTDLLAEGFVSMPLLGGLLAAGIGVVRRQESILLSLRSVLFGLLRVIAPVFALGTLVFSVALLFQGLETLWDGWITVVLLCSTLAAGLVFVNAVVQDHEGPGGALGVAARVQGLVLPVLAGLAAYGMMVRIGEHGLTPARIVASIVAGFAVAYALAYALAGATNRWAVLRWSNVGLALALAGTLAYALTPLFRVNAWSAADQIARLEAGAVSPEAFDYAALAFDMGEPGRDALESLAAGEGEASELAAQALEAEYRFAIEGPPPPTAAQDAYMAGLLVRPAGTALPGDLREELARRVSADIATRAPEQVVLLLPGYEDGRDGALWVRRSEDAYWVSVQLFVRASEEGPGVTARPWAYATDLGRDFGPDGAAEAAAFVERARTAPFGPVPVTLIAPGIDGEPPLPRDVQPFTLPPEPEG